jgi:hypothetical protein
LGRDVWQKICQSEEKLLHKKSELVEAKLPKARESEFV